MGIVIINGKRYDSVTGLMVADAATTVKHSRTSHASGPTEAVPSWVNSYIDAPDENGPSLTDGAERPAAQAVLSAPAAIVGTIQEAPATKAAKTMASTVSARPTHRSAQPARHTVGQSRTLNRRFVRKPLTETGEYAQSMAAQHLAQSKISRRAVASAVTASPTTPRRADISLWQSRPSQPSRQPLHQPARVTVAAPAASTKETEAVQTVPVRPATQQAQPRPTMPTTPNQARSIRPDAVPTASPTIPVRHAQPTVSGSFSNNNYDADAALDQRLEQLSKILQNAQTLDRQQNQSPRARRQSRRSSHQQQRSLAAALPKPAKRRFGRPAIMAAAGAAVVAIAIGFYAFMPSISIKLAANRAGIVAKNPYIPAGYTLDGDVAYQSGRVTTNYRSRSGSDGYSITQETSDGDEAALRQEASAKNDGYYQEVQVDGKTVYMYRDLISWLDNGMKYTINSNDYLDNQQIADIVKSL